MADRNARVQWVKQEALDIKSFELFPAAGGSLSAFTPGSHIDVHPAPAIVRQYLLLNGPRCPLTTRYPVNK